MIRTGKRKAQLTIWSQKQLHSAAAAAANQRFQQQQLVADQNAEIILH